jgi:hypothetical protein
VTDFAGDESSELERKAKALAWVALVETLSYSLLLYCWLIAQSDLGTKLVGSVHGMIALAFAAMVIMITPEMRWSWWFCALVILTGPIGALVVFARIRREGVPAVERSEAAT